MILREAVIQRFRQRFGRSPHFLAIAPGRVNLLGEHVDYNEGFVLPAAIDRATYLAFAPAGTDSSTLLAADFGEETTFTTPSLANKTDNQGNPLSEWVRYPAGVAWSLASAGLSTPPMQGVFCSTVPRGAGLSSSASVEMAFAVAWAALGGWALPPMRLALLAQKAENEFVGVHCGIMDQFASACGVAGHLLLLDCRSLEWRPLPLPPTIAIVIADTSVRRRLSASSYNERRQACEQAVEILRNDLPHIHSLRDVTPTDFYRLRHRLPPLVAKRAQHVVEEIERCHRAVSLLENGDIPAFGNLMNECHRSLRDLYEVSILELDIMVEIAQSLPGCYGARLTGAGFGGCTVNLVEQSAAQSFAQTLAARYQEQTGLKPEIYICQASAGAQVVTLAT